MEELFSVIAEGWDSGFSDVTENALSADLVSDSISKANDFFFSGDSFGHSGESTMYGDHYLAFDNPLYSHMQLDSFGITGQDALDMALAFAGTNQMLQGMDSGLSLHQEELCCDFMAGIRAGLNGTDVSPMTEFLKNQPYIEDHTLGVLRAKIMEEGMNFAQEYMESHHDNPNFTESMEQFQESKAKGYGEIAELMDDRYASDCTMQHYKELLKNGVDGFDSIEDCEDALRRYFSASAEYGQLSNEISFKSRESMLPYEEYSSSIYDLNYPERNPFGVYIMFHSNVVHSDEILEKPYLPNNFIDIAPKEGTRLLQEACDAMCDAAGMRHIKVFLTSNPEIPNAAHHPGILPFTYIDDTLYLNRDYARECIQHFGNTDSLLVDMAHEIGHALNMVHCGRLDRKSDETLADMFSTILTSKMGIDIEVSREWNQWKYDGHGNSEYKSSEGRWDTAAVGKYWTENSTIDSYIEALKDKHFREMVYNYNVDSIETVTEMAQKELDYQINEAGGNREKIRNGFDNVLKYFSFAISRI